MTYFEAKVQIETDETLNEVASKVFAALYAGDIDAAGVQVREFDTTPVYDAADEYDYDEVQTFGSNEVIRHPTRLREVDPDSHTADLLEALKTNGDRYHG